jgi:acyl-CoA reductase-like NAD-dependent aldehyde dehydrogenase
MEADEARRARALAVVDVARRIADGGSSVGREAREAVLATSGLSPEGVELALSEHVETEVTAADLDRLVAWCRAAGRCHAVLSAQVCVGAVRAVALAAATAPAVLVRPSRRDPALASILARELTAHRGFRGAGGSIEVVGDLAASSGDEVHAYGSDEAMAALERSLAPGLRFRGHGTGFGVAWVSRASDLASAAAALARDVVVFDQRGCLSPRLALVEGDGARALRFAALLDGALGDLGRSVPRGPLSAGARAEVSSFVALAQSAGEARVGRDHVVAFLEGPTALLPPAARAVTVVAAPSNEAVARLMAPYFRYITAVGGDIGDDDAARPLGELAGIRRSALGLMQKPPLDGPVDLRPKR